MLHLSSLNLLQAEAKGKRFLCRTAASFVSARIGIEAKPPIHPSDVGITKVNTGGLIIVGSYVPKTTKQVYSSLLCLCFLCDFRWLNHAFLFFIWTYAQVEALISKFAEKLKCVEVGSSFKSTTKLLSITWNFSSCDYFVLPIQISLFAYSCVIGLWHFSLEQVSVDKVSMKSFQERDEEINRVAEIASVSLKAGKDTLLVTSRQLVTGKCQYFPFFYVCVFSFICGLMLLYFLLCLWIFPLCGLMLSELLWTSKISWIFHRKNKFSMFQLGHQLLDLIKLTCHKVHSYKLHFFKNQLINTMCFLLFPKSYILPW